MKITEATAENISHFKELMSMACTPTGLRNGEIKPTVTTTLDDQGWARKNQNFIRAYSQTLPQSQVKDIVLELKKNGSRDFPYLNNPQAVEDLKHATVVLSDRTPAKRQ